MKEAAYKGLVRPVLEYGISVWDPHTHGLQEELEKVQNRAARFVTAVIFLPIKPTPVSGIVPNAKKYVFFPIEAGKIPKMTDIFLFRLLFILVFCKPSLSLSFLVNF